MGFLNLMLPWVNRLVVLVSVVLLALLSLDKQGDLPLSRATLRLAHLCAFRFEHKHTHGSLLRITTTF